MTFLPEPLVFKLFLALSIHLSAIWSSSANANVLGTDERLTINEFARALRTTETLVRAKYAATGRLHCSTAEYGWIGTVQLTGRNDVVTSVAHLFWTDRSCRAVRDVRQCWVEFPNISRKRFMIKLNSISLGGCHRTGGADVDWAVFELAEPAVGITPYSLPTDIGAFQQGSSVLQVSAGARNFRPNVPANPFFAHFNFAICKIRDRFRHPLFGIQTDCDMGPGASGSAILSEDTGAPVIVGVVAFGMMQIPGGEYESSTNFNMASPLAGEFLRDIERRLQRK